jgi:uncharacterized membrane protein YsdA (DUF1294 family)
MLPDTPAQILLLIGLFLINLIAFILIGYDKYRSRQGNGVDRLPEGLLFFAGTAFGSAGLYAGMLLFRHKTRKWCFMLGIPLLIAQNFAAVYFVWKLFGQ